jgi:hypothetical protein
VGGESCIIANFTDVFRIVNSIYNEPFGRNNVGQTDGCLMTIYIYIYIYICVCVCVCVCVCIYIILIVILKSLSSLSDIRILG